MLVFLSCPKRRAEANLQHFPVLHIKYEDPRIKVKVQHHDVFRATLVRADGAGWWHGPSTSYKLRGAMPELAAFLATHDEGIIRSKVWDYDRYKITLRCKTPVSIGDYANIETIHMTYYTWTANTPEMMAWRAERHV